MKPHQIQNNRTAPANPRVPTTKLCTQSEMSVDTTGRIPSVEWMHGHTIKWILVATIALSCTDDAQDASTVQTDTNVVAMVDLIPGLWVREYASGREEYEFGAAGDYAFRAYTAGKSTPDQTSTGTWSADAQRLTVDTGTTREVSPFVVDSETFSRSQVYVRMGTDSNSPIGTWEYRIERFQTKNDPPDLTLTSTRTDTLVFFNDGTSTFSSQELTANGSAIVPPVVDRPGTWTLTGTTIAVSDSVHVVEYELMGDRIYDTNSSWIYKAAQN